jgi:replicative DNA helicase
MNVQDEIIGQFLWYPEAAHYLPKMNPNWFTSPLHRKILAILTADYLQNEPTTNLSLSRALKKDELIQTLTIQQKVSVKLNLGPYLRKLEVEYNHDKLINRLQGLNYAVELPELVKQVEQALEEVQITSNKEPKSVQKEVNRVVDLICETVKNNGKMTGKASGWRYLDKYLGGYNAGDLIVIAGRPAMGKTALALTLTKDFCAEGGKALFLSLEMSNEQLAKRYLSLIGGINNSKLRNANLSAAEVESICKTANSQTINFFIDDDAETSISQLKAKVKAHKGKHGLELVVIDYIQLVKGTKQNREQEVAEISRALKLLAKDLGITVIILAQLSRASEQRLDKRPLLSDLRESGAIEQDADVVLFPFRPAYYEQDKPVIEDAELIIAKNRNGESVTIPVLFTGALTQYKEKINA